MDDLIKYDIIIISSKKIFRVTGGCASITFEQKPQQVKPNL